MSVATGASKRVRSRVLVRIAFGCFWAVVLGACGGSDDSETATASPSSIRADTSVADGEASADESVDTTDEVVTTTEDDGVTTTEEDGVTTTEDDGVTTTEEEVTTTEDDEVTTTEDDEVTTTESTVVGESLAEQLLDANLYSIPGLRSACDPLGLDRYPEPIYVSYLFAADGGDIYELCIVPPGRNQNEDKVGTLEEGSLSVTDPSGRSVVDVAVSEYEAWEVVASGQAMGPGSQLVVAYDDGTRRVHGMQIHWPNTIVIPFFLPHDRPAGRWSISYSSASGSRSIGFQIDAPCRDEQPSRPSTDPLDFSGVRFVRSQDAKGYTIPAPIAVDFDHCRLAPDVVGKQTNEAVQILQRYADLNGKATEVSVRDCAPDATVTFQGPPAGSIFRAELYRSIMGRSTAEDQERSTGIGC